MDLPREELMQKAQEVLNKYKGPGHAQVFFKYTCEQCGERCILSEPNKLYESGECCECHHITRIDKGGMMLEIVKDGDGK